MENKKQKKHLAEHSFKLTLSDFGRGLLLPQNKIANDKLYFLHREAEELKGLSGSITLEKENKKIELSFNVNLNNTPKKIILYYNKKPEDEIRVIRQEIKLSESVATFGTRPYFECECGHNASVLYMPKGQTIFKCRTCSRITYESTKINKQSLNGLGYIIYKLTRLADKRERIQRMYHAGRLTRKGQVFWDEYEAWQKEVTSQREALIDTHKLLTSHNI